MPPLTTHNKSSKVHSEISLRQLSPKTDLDQMARKVKSLQIASGAIGTTSVLAEAVLKGLSGDIIGSATAATKIAEPAQRLYSSLNSSNKEEKPSALGKFYNRQKEKFAATRLGQNLSKTYHAIANNSVVKKILATGNKVITNRIFKKSIKIGSAAFLLATASSNPFTLAAAVVSLTAVAVMTTKQCLEIRKGVHLEKKKDSLLKRNANANLQQAMLKQLDKPGLEHLKDSAVSFLGTINQIKNAGSDLAHLKPRILREWGQALGASIVEGASAIILGMNNPGLGLAAGVSTLGGVGREVEEVTDRRIVHRNLEQEIRSLNNGQKANESFKTISKTNRENEVKINALTKLMQDPEMKHILTLSSEEQHKAFENKLAGFKQEELDKISKRSPLQAVGSAFKSGWNYFKCSQLREFVTSPYADPVKFQAKIEQDRINFNQQSQNHYDTTIKAFDDRSKQLSIQHARASDLKIEDLDGLPLHIGEFREQSTSHSKVSSGAVPNTNSKQTKATFSR